MKPLLDRRATPWAGMTPLGFGGAEIGNLFEAMPEEQAEAAVATALEGGVRYFDTAPFYASHRCPIPLGDDALGPAPVCSHEPPGSM